MAVRLPVILIQSPAPSAAAQRMFEDVVGQLIGAEGIDLALVGPLSALEAAATDRLALESRAGDLAVLDWQSPEAIVQGLVSVEIDAGRAAHPHDQEAPATSAAKRRVFAFDLGRFEKAGDVVAALRDLNQRRQIRTFSIGLGAPRSGPAEVVSAVDPASRQAEERPAPSARRPQEPVARTRDPRSESRETRLEGGAGGFAADGNRPSASPTLDLDDLLDQLDQADP